MQLKLTSKSNSFQGTWLLYLKFNVSPKINSITGIRLLYQNNITLPPPPPPPPPIHFFFLLGQMGRSKMQINWIQTKFPIAWIPLAKGKTFWYLNQTGGGHGGRHHGRVKGDGIKGLPGLDLPSPGTCTPIRISFMLSWLNCIQPSSNWGRSRD